MASPFVCVSKCASLFKLMSVFPYGIIAQCEDLPIPLPYISQLPEKVIISQKELCLLSLELRPFIWYLHFYSNKFYLSSHFKEKYQASPLRIHQDGERAQGTLDPNPRGVQVREKILLWVPSLLPKLLTERKNAPCKSSELSFIQGPY